MTSLKKTYGLIFLLVILILLPAGCGSSKKNPYYEKRSKASSKHSSQLGRNKYYFSNSYQKKLAKSYKRK
jgi:hypothetical protein